MIYLRKEMKILHKFIFIIILFFSFNTYSYDSSSCFTSNFDSLLSNKSLYGLLKSDLVLKKQGCLIEFFRKRFFILKDIWRIDLCREPIHIKKGADNNISVYKRDGNCTNKSSNSTYCKQTETLIKIIRDEALIFAKGDKEVLSDDHGKFYCVYLLLHSYLNKGVIFSTRSEPIDLLNNIKNKSNLLQSSSSESIKEDNSKDSKTGSF